MKAKRIIICILAAFFALLPASCASMKQEPFVPEYNIGDTGPGGGIVFYVSAEGFDVHDGKVSVRRCNYLEVSRQEVAHIRWCPHNDGCTRPVWEVLTRATEIGYGKRNTCKIIQYHQNSANAENCAAYACFAYSTPSTKKGEWFLPSKDELDMMYKNVGYTIMQDASDAWHWSSSTQNDRIAWLQHFCDGIQNGSHMSNDYCVRAVRAF